MALADDNMRQAENTVKEEEWFTARQIRRAGLLDSGILLIFDDDAECFITWVNGGIRLIKKEPPNVP